MDSMMDNVILALQYLNPADLDYDSWLRIGMALRNEGYPVEVWENWSKGEERYHPGECVKKWATFGGYIGPKVSGGSIIQMAKDRGWRSDSNRELDWDDEIVYDGDTQDTGYRRQGTGGAKAPTEQLKLYLQTLFQPSDIVGYVTGDVGKNE